MTAGWLREEQPDSACEKILDAAEKAFIEEGVSAAGMSKIAQFAGCSRGTLYRYFKSRHALHLAFVDRAALRIVERVRAAVEGIADPRERLIESILCSVHEVRGNPATAVWFEPGVSGMAARMSRSSEVVETLTAGFVSRLQGQRQDDAESGLQARWFVRIIVSLLAMPGANEAEERAVVERFAVPAALGARPGRQRRRQECVASSS